MAADHLRMNSTDYAPFAGLLPNSPDYEEYCRKVQSVADAEWGGQLEIRALSNCLEKRILVYDALSSTPILMGDEFTGTPLRLTYHRHYYALGEHYNSVEKFE